MTDAGNSDLPDEGIQINEKCRTLLAELCDEERIPQPAEIDKLLTSFRILTREKTLSPSILNYRCLQMLVNCSSKCHTEAQKCLSNLILNYPHLRESIIDPYTDCVKKRFENVIDGKDWSFGESISQKHIREVLHYDLRIVFLLSALCPGSRSRIRDRLLEDIISVTLEEAKLYSEENHLLIVESLKTLFNLTMNDTNYSSHVGDVIKQLLKFIRARRIQDSQDSLEQLLVNLIHLLTNMPRDVYLRLTDEEANLMLDYLDIQLKSYSRENVRDTVLPVLNVCANICKHNDSIRKRWFEEVIKSSSEFDKRPEEYNTFRGRLCKLMTSVDVHIKDIAAEFMHAMCGGDTEKFITYTGFGNAAAFLSSRGLLTGKSLHERSEESLNTDEVEYCQLRDKIDPITGKLDVPKKNPMEGMSEEEKEYHAHELATAITKLANLGVMKPVRVDEEGRVQELHPEYREESKGHIPD